MEQGKGPSPVDSWVKLYADDLYAWAYYRVSNKEQAEDLVQETFLSALRNRDSFRGESSEKTWLHTILKNKIIDYYRSHARKATAELDQRTAKNTEYFDESGHWTDEASPQDWGVDDSQPLEREEFMQALEKCKGKLSPAQNSAFTMKYIDDLPAEEICKELGIQPSNYWVLIHRAKLQLRKCLEINWKNL